MPVLQKMSKNKTPEHVEHIELPPIPDKLYFTIGEVSKLCALKPHVLRYWEQEFKELKPSKRRGNRRYYQRKDVLMIRQIRSLLYEQGFTINGARTKLSGEKQGHGVGDTQNARQYWQEVVKALEFVVEELEEAQ